MPTAFEDGEPCHMLAQPPAFPSTPTDKMDLEIPVESLSTVLRLSDPTPAGFTVYPPTHPTLDFGMVNRLAGQA